MAAGAAPSPADVRAGERGAELALLPLATTFAYYLLPDKVQDHLLVQFLPQCVAYVAFGLWAGRNTGISARLGLAAKGCWAGARWGLLTGLALGCVNTFAILALAPSFGYDIAFLKSTPHAHIPVPIMVPWFICAIAVFVEVNFRGFLLGRLVWIEATWWKSDAVRRLSPIALFASALTFTYDPFMVRTFQHLHWIALWDGVIWGAIWIRSRNLFIPIVAHAVEVIVTYCAVRTVLLP
jgi:hypothetical protein